MSPETCTPQVPAPENDFFISHASQDKKMWAIPLKQELEDLGCKVWVDSEHIEPGTSIIKELDEGLRKSRYMIAIVSQHSLVSKWCQKEWSVATKQTIETDYQYRIFPIRHKVTADQFAQENLLLGDVLSLDTRQSLRQIAGALVRAISEPELRNQARTTRQLHDLQPREFDPQNPEPREYLAKIALRAAQASTAAFAVAAQQPKPHPVWVWSINLFLCLFAAAVVAASLTSRCNPRVRVLKMTVDDLEIRLKTAQQGWGKLRNIETRLSSNIAHLQGQLDYQTKLTQANKAKFEQSETYRTQLKYNLNQKLGEMKGVQGELNALQKRLGQEWKAYDANVKKVAEAEAKAVNAQEVNDQAQNELVAERAEQAKLRAELADLQQRQEKHNLDLAGMRGEIGGHLKHIKELQEELDERAVRVIQRASTQP